MFLFLTIKALGNHQKPLLAISYICGICFSRFKLLVTKVQSVKGFSFFVSYGRSEPAAI